MALPSSGPLSLNDMHVEVNGTSGTTCSINDSDIRGLIDKADGAQSSFNEFYGAANVSYISASGGSTTTSGNYKYHYFNSSGTFTINSAGVGGSQYTTVDYIVIAGGGSGANAFPGGGAGGYLRGTFTGTTGARTITVGGGGTGGYSTQSNSGGSNSSISGVATATGGGKAAQGGIPSYGSASAAGNGGSGGGASMWNTTGGNGTSGQGNDAGDGRSSPGSNESYLCGSGGGGASLFYYQTGGAGGSGIVMFRYQYQN